jgi:uncharacterized protein with HEPN domain
MSRERRERDYLADILEAIQRIQEYTDGLKDEAYYADYKTQDAVVRNLEVIGEAAKNISEDFRTEHLQVPWRDLAGVRDKLIHQYFGINQEIVWQIIQKDLPALLLQIERLLGEIG